jgi:hypothetical protein
MTKVNFYNHDGSQIVRSREYPTRAKAIAAIKRAQQNRRIALIAQMRTTRDQPTVHH